MISSSITKDLTVLYWGYGDFAYVCERFSKSFKRVLLYIPYEESFPKYNKYTMGSGLVNVEKVNSPWPYFDEVDLWYFPDLYFGELVMWLRAQGKAVFGAGLGEKMELLRDMMKGMQQHLGMELNQYDVIYGLDNLQKYLQENDNKYIKTNVLRGGMETWHHENIKLSQPILDELNHSLGIFKENQVFIAESPIDNCCEVGYDGFVMEGNYPSKTLFGVEIKDSAYIGIFSDYDKLPTPIKDINRRLSPAFENFGYRGWLSSEVRIPSPHNGILLDITCRAAEPPTSLAIEMLEDFPLYVWQVAIGEVPNVKSKYKYGAQLVIKSDWARTDPQALYYPDQYRHHVKIKNKVTQNGVTYFVPIPAQEMTEIGAVIGMGNTLQAAIDQAKLIASQVKGHGIKIDGSSLDEANEEIKKLANMGVRVF